MATVNRCPHCGTVLATNTMPQAIRQASSSGPTSMERIKNAARKINPDATDKQVYNAIALLIRSGRLRKVAHGFYQAL